LKANNKNTNARYREVRKIKGTQQEVANSLGLWIGTINRRESAKKKVPITEEMMRAIESLQDKKLD